jgi:hypothetical protein
VASIIVKRRIFAAVLMCITQVCHAGENVQVLKTNPFMIPAGYQEQFYTPSQVKQEQSVPFVLRGTMVSGKRSLANINSVILSLGDEIDGYKLVAIQQREVVLLKNNNRRILSIDEAKEGVQR